MQTLLRLADLLDAFIDRFGRIAAWSSLALVLLMAFNVLLRYFFRTGSVGLQEMEWHIMAFLSLTCMAYTTLKDGHVQVDILYVRFSDRVKRIITFISCTLILIVAAILLKLSVPYVMQSYTIGESSPDPGGLSNRWIVKSLLIVGFALLVVQSLSAWLRALVALLTGGVADNQTDGGHGGVTHAA
ncbi:MAG: TRAP transporter small permease subunit [Hyphomicrobiales bacterium]|nr:TRAP transporter small permease subunit [Hyphomicrobiales bacterium]